MALSADSYRSITFVTVVNPGGMGFRELFGSVNHQLDAVLYAELTDETVMPLMPGMYP